MNKPFCRKCLYGEEAVAKEFENIPFYIEAIPKERRAEEKEYQQRLLKCQQCNHLFQGICRKCGCFVELRAAKKDLHCPDWETRW